MAIKKDLFVSKISYLRDRTLLLQDRSRQNAMWGAIRERCLSGLRNACSEMKQKYGFSLVWLLASLVLAAGFYSAYRVCVAKPFVFRVIGAFFWDAFDLYPLKRRPR
ncbi:hypothetical protein [Silvibacterium dinghuense]|uniref:Uncharacterized protein n=1 Tax=Silvibacterium dinghuense TaxID=1560006 RepID=A0A4Q1SJY0_9BACT|nr:hypothetical protein [Silvibacterium dinghuense]RXS97984.1 hypothetical protein ESZ00_09090 [Silvibacterium dinghuense]